MVVTAVMVVKVMMVVMVVMVMVMMIMMKEKNQAPGGPDGAAAELRAHLGLAWAVGYNFFFLLLLVACLYSNSDDPYDDPFGRGCEKGANNDDYNDDDKCADGDEGHDYYLQVGPPLFGLLVLGRSAECRVGRQYLAQV